MPLIQYKEVRFQKRSLAIIQVANKIIAEYEADNMKLTLRQLYYQFVARGFIENSIKSYNNLGNVISDARLAGMIDWEAIEDRTRNLAGYPTWLSPKELLEENAKRFKFDWWDNQPFRIEVWVEKEALAGVVGRTALKYRCDYFCCRGYNSQSEAWNAGQRFQGYAQCSQPVKIIHLGDHDPSGIDMTRDNDDRLMLFGEGIDIEVIRVALNTDQVTRYNPPPNPAKVQDPRFGDYRSKFGDESWELDALDPRVIDQLISTEIEHYIDWDAWEIMKEKEKKAKERLKELSDKWKD